MEEVQEYSLKVFKEEYGQIIDEKLFFEIRCKRFFLKWEEWIKQINKERINEYLDVLRKI